MSECWAAVLIVAVSVVVQAVMIGLLLAELSILSEKLDRLK